MRQKPLFSTLIVASRRFRLYSSEFRPDPLAAATVVPRFPAATATAVISRLSAATATTVVPRFSAITTTAVISQLSVTTATTVVPRFSATTAAIATAAVRSKSVSDPRGDINETNDDDRADRPIFPHVSTLLFAPFKRRSPPFRRRAPSRLSAKNALRRPIISVFPAFSRYFPHFFPSPLNHASRVDPAGFAFLSDSNDFSENTRAKIVGAPRESLKIGCFSPSSPLY